jgi:xanthine/uracil permease
VNTLPVWADGWGAVALLLGVSLVLGVFLWHGPIVMDRSTVVRLRPLAMGLIVVHVVAMVAVFAAGGWQSLRLLLGLPALAYLAYTWSDEYLDEINRRRWQSYGGRRLGRWRAGTGRGRRRT